MSVKPGLPGQEFIKTTVPRVKNLKDKLKKDGHHILISVDGGINGENKDFLGDADILVSGSYITNSDNYKEAIESLR